MRRFVLFALGVSLVIAAIPSPSLAGVLTPEAVQHAARVQQESLQLVSEIGGTLNTVVVEGHHAYVGAGRRLVVLDAFDPSHPELVFQTDPLGGSVSAIFIQGDKVYATAGNALYVFGISTPLTQPPALVGVYEFIAGDELPYWATDVAVQGDYAYVTFRRGDWLSGGDGLLKVIDVSDPTAPTETGGYYLGSYATSLAVDGDYAYVCTRNGLTVVDVSDPSSPYKRGVSEDVLGGQDVAVSGNYAFVASASGDGFRVLSIVNPDNPQQVGSYKTNWSAYGVEVDTSRAYVSDTQGGLHILSIATVANPTRVGSYDLSDNPDGDHLAAWYLAVAGDTAYVVIDRDSLRVVDISDEENPSKLGSYETPVADPTAVKVVDGTAYVTDYKHGLTILSLANPAAPQVVGVWEKDDPFLWPDDVDVVGNYAYVLGDSALVVVDVSNRAAPLEVGRCSDDGGVTITVAGDHAYVIALGKGLYVFDISNPADPTLVTPTPFGFDGTGMETWTLSRAVVRGSRLYTTCGGKVCVANIANPANPTIHVKHEIDGTARDVDIAAPGDHLYVADAGNYDSWAGWADGGLRILHILPSSFSEVGYAPTQRPGPASDRFADQVAVADDAREAYLVERAEIGDSLVYDYVYTLRVVDLRDASDPTAAGSFDLPGVPGNVTADDDYAYVPLREVGLLVFRYIASTSRSISPSGGTLESSADNTNYTFPPGTFAQPATVTHTPLTDDGTPATGGLVGIGHAYEISAVDDVTAESVEPTQPYTVTIAYSDAETGPALEETLALYSWDGGEWVEEPTSELDIGSNTITAAPDHFSSWAVLGETRRVFLPLIVRSL